VGSDCEGVGFSEDGGLEGLTDGVGCSETMLGEGV
jgi:hypothetical protein